MVEPKMKFIIPYSNKVMLILYSRIISYLIFIILLYSNIILIWLISTTRVHTFFFRGTRKCSNFCGSNPETILLRGRIDILFDTSPNTTAITDLKMVLFYQYECETGILNDVLNLIL